MTLIEIIVIVLVVLFMTWMIGSYVYKKIHHQPTGECACCKGNINKMFKEIRKSEEKTCSCKK